MNKILIAFSVVWLLCCSAPAMGQESMGDTSTETEIGADSSRPPQKKKKRRRRKNRRQRHKDGSSGSPLGSAAGIHSAQEGEADEPYSWETSLTSDLAIVSTEAGESKTGSGVNNIDLKALRIFAQSVEIGLQLSLDESTVKTGDAVTTSRTALGIGLFTYNFGNIDKDEWIFFVNLGVGVGQRSVTIKGGSEVAADTGAARDGASASGETDSSGGAAVGLQRITAGLGFHYFVDTNVALTPQISYDADTSKVGDVQVKSTTFHIAKFGLTLFI